MKKKGLAIFALAAVMSLGAMGITAFAAGWSQGQDGHRRMENGFIMIPAAVM